MAKPRSAANILQKGNKKANQLSPAMFAWAKANKDKLRKVATKRQKEIFAKYDAMVKAGNTPANPNPRTTPSKPKNSKKLKTNNNNNNKDQKREFPSLMKNKGTGRDGKGTGTDPNFGTGTYGRGYPDDKRKKLLEKIRENRLG